MLRRVVIGASLACLMGGAAYAVDEPAEGEDQCTQQLAAAEEAVQNKIDANTLSEEDTEKVNSSSTRRMRNARKETSPRRPTRLPPSTRSWANRLCDVRGGVVSRRPEPFRPARPAVP